jgi:hypothetical protein
MLEQKGSSLVVRATRIVNRVREIMRLTLYFGIQQSFTIACSHYENIDLMAMSQGYVPGYTDTQLDKIEKMAAFPANNLANSLCIKCSIYKKYKMYMCYLNSRRIK